MSETAEPIEDFNLLLPKPRLIKVKDRVFDVSFFPASIAIELLGAMSQMNGTDIKPEIFETFVNIVTKICQVSNPDINREWVAGSFDPVTLMKFLKISMEALNAGMKAFNLNPDELNGTSGGSGEGAGGEGEKK